MQHRPRPLAPAKAKLYESISELSDRIVPENIICTNLHYDEVRGDALRRPHAQHQLQ